MCDDTTLRLARLHALDGPHVISIITPVTSGVLTSRYHNMITDYYCPLL